MVSSDTVMPCCLSLRQHLGPVRSQGFEQEVARDVKMRRLRQQSRRFDGIERDLCQASPVGEHGPVILPDQAQPDRGPEPVRRGQVIRGDPEARDAVAQKTPEQIIPHLAVQTHSSAEPRELGREDPG